MKFAEQDFVTKGGYILFQFFFIGLVVFGSTAAQSITIAAEHISAFGSI